MAKIFLDAAGLAAYDKLIKEYIDKANNQDNESQKALAKEIEDLQSYVDEKVETLEGDISDVDQKVDELKSTVEADEEKIAANEEAIKAAQDAIDVLNGDDETEGSVAKQVSDAIADVLDGAPEALDTLKEIADWIAADETGTAALVDRVSQAEEDIKDLSDKEAEDVEALQEAIDALAQTETEALNTLKDYVDKQDLDYYNSIGSIEEAEIILLFKTPVEVAEGQTVAEAVAALKDDEVLVLPADTTVAEDLVVPAGASIDANGAVFTGTVTIPKDSEVIIKNAVFVNPIEVQ